MLIMAKITTIISGITQFYITLIDIYLSFQQNLWFNPYHVILFFLGFSHSFSYPAYICSLNCAFWENCWRMHSHPSSTTSAKRPVIFQAWRQGLSPATYTSSRQINQQMERREDLESMALHSTAPYLYQEYRTILNLGWKPGYNPLIISVISGLHGSRTSPRSFFFLLGILIELNVGSPVPIKPLTAPWHQSSLNPV